MQTSEDFSTCRKGSSVLYISNSLIVCGMSDRLFELFLWFFIHSYSTSMPCLKEIKTVFKLVCNICRAALKNRSNPYKGEETNNINRDTNMDDRL
jgi:hypothetical protein